MVRRGASSLAIVVLLQWSLAAACPKAETPAALSRKVARLIEQLGDADRTVRAAAEQQLMDLGPGSLPHLPRPEELASPAQREAVARMRELLERTLARESVEASRIRLQGTFALAELVRQVELQSGNRLLATDLPSALQAQSRAVDWDDVTFWDCISELSRHFELSARIDPEAGALSFQPAGSAAKPTLSSANSGAFRIEVQTVSLRPDFTDPSRHILRVQYEILSEPRLRPLFIRIDQANSHLESEAGTLEPLDPTARRERPVERRDAVVVTSDFVVPEGLRAEQVTFSGRIDAELAAGRETFEFRHLEDARHVVRRSGAVTVTLEGVQEPRSDAFNADPKSLRLDLRVVYDTGGPAFESHRTWVYHNEAFLRAASGNQRWFHAGFDTLGADDGAVRLSYRFEDVEVELRDLEFVYNAPTLIISVPVEFTVSNLPIDAQRPAEADTPSPPRSD